MSTVHTVAVHFRYARYMRRLVNEFLGQNPITLRASCGAVYCNRSCLCMYPHQTGFVGKVSSPADKILAVPRPWEEVCGGAKFLAPSYYSQSTVFASPPSAFFHKQTQLFIAVVWAQCMGG